MEGKEYIDVRKYMQVLADTGYDSTKIDIPSMDKMGS
jgi:hypothetical protein